MTTRSALIGSRGQGSAGAFRAWPFVCQKTTVGTLRGALAAGMLLAVPVDLASQTIPDTPSCSSCTVHTEVIAVLGYVDGPGALANVRGVSVDAHGRYWVFSDLVPAVFETNGTFMQEVGRKGEGPGEFRSPSRLSVLPGDSILVHDLTQFHVFGPDLVFSRAIRSPLLGSRDLAKIDWPSRVVVNALDPHPGHFGLPFHEVSMEASRGEVLRSFGEVGEIVTQSSMYYLLPHALLASPQGGYWSLAAGLFDVTKWSASHEPEFTLERRPDWFPGRSDMGGGGFETPPRPRCLGLSKDESDLLWTVCLVASPNYQDALSRAAAEMERARAAGAGAVGLPASAFDDHLLYHTRIEVIDPRAGRVVATHHLDAGAISVLPGRRVAVLRHSPEGVPFVDIYQMTLRRQ